MFQVCCPSFTDQFTIKAGESNSKGLKSTERVIIVQSEHIFCYTTKLHHDVVSWGEKTFRDEQFHSEAKEKNQTTTTKKKSQTKPNHKNPTRLAVPNMCGWCIHSFPPEWENLSSRVTVLFQRLLFFSEPKLKPFFCQLEGAVLNLSFHFKKLSFAPSFAAVMGSSVCIHPRKKEDLQNFPDSSEVPSNPELNSFTQFPFSRKVSYSSQLS